jgi:hypothetical protein
MPRRPTIFEGMEATVGCSPYLPSSQISAASFQSLPIFSHTTTYLPVTSCGVGPLVLRLKVPISRAAEDPSGLTSSVVSFASLTCSAMLFHSASIAALPFTMPEPGAHRLNLGLLGERRRNERGPKAITGAILRMAPDLT